MSPATNSRTALVTGATIGIGREIAELYAARGVHLVLVARNAEGLALAAKDLSARHGIRCETLSLDLSAPNAAEKVFRFTEDRKIDVTDLVNNAGFGAAGRFDAIDWKTSDEMIRLNITALAELTYRYLPKLKAIPAADGGGRILNVGSIAAFQPGPLMAVYYASKAFVVSFSEALSEELSGSGVTVTCLCPGPTLTGFQERAAIAKVPLFKSAFVMTAREVAESGLAGLYAGKRVVIPGSLNRMAAGISRLTPHGITLKAVRRLHTQARGEP